jgi:thiol-disulfide isomerase/thioredoxin
MILRKLAGLMAKHRDPARRWVPCGAMARPALRHADRERQATATVGVARGLALVSLLATATACTAEPVAPAAARASGAGNGQEQRHDAVGQRSALGQRPHFVLAGSGEVDAVVREALTAATAEERRVVVYVGAVWCEPCQAFHQAVERGELDAALAGVRFIEFDSDHDGPRLQAAGYGGRYIPRFVLPQADGRGSEQRMEGGIKGDGAVANLMERLQPLLAPAAG